MVSPDLIDGLTRRDALKAFGVGTGMSITGFTSRTFGKRAFTPHLGSIVVEQGNNSFNVTPLNTGETVEEFYGLDGARANTSTDIEQSDVSHLFLFEGPEGLSLVVIHDRRNDGSGGAATLVFSGLPIDQGEWVVQDCPNDFDSKTDTTPDWNWLDSFTDGGAFRGGLDDGFDITIDPGFNEDAVRPPGSPGRIEEWQFLSGDATSPDRTQLELDVPVTIRSDVISASVDIMPGSDPNTINCEDESKIISVAVLTTEEFNATTIDHTTVTFEGASEVHLHPKTGEPKRHEDDVNGDGDSDLLFHFKQSETDLTCDTTKGTLTGETFSGDRVVGTDSVQMFDPGKCDEETDLSTGAADWQLTSVPDSLEGQEVTVGPAESGFTDDLEEAKETDPSLEDCEVLGPSRGVRGTYVYELVFDVPVAGDCELIVSVLGGDDTITLKLDGETLDSYDLAVDGESGILDADVNQPIGSGQHVLSGEVTNRIGATTFVICAMLDCTCPGP